MTRAIKVSTHEKVQRRQNKDNVKEWAFEMELSLVAHLLRENAVLVRIAIFPEALFFLSCKYSYFVLGLSDWLKCEIPTTPDM